MDITLTIILTCIVVVAYIVCAIYTKKQKDKGTLENKRRWIEQLPSLVSTCGVLGTFIGITVGLFGFDPQNIAKSIPELLEGLSTAFTTSLAGMTGSLLLSRQVNKAFDNIEKGVSDSRASALMVVDAIQKLALASQNQVNTQNQFYAGMTTTINQVKQGIDSIVSKQISQESFDNYQNQSVALQTQIANAQTKFYAEMTTTINQVKQGIDSIVSKQISQEFFDNYQNQSVALQTQIANVQTLLHQEINNQLIPNVITVQESSKALAGVTPDIKRLNNIVGEIMDVESSQSSQLDEVSDKVSKLTDKLHSEVVEIEDTMEKTNSLLEMKFTEFTELLKKSNTEALVEVMKKVTEEFQKQMGDLINKLVQENFDQLNKSVERLNTWQVENKEMIETLTKQYKQMADNFDATSDTLSKVGGDTKLLVSDGGKLRQIIDALNKVMVEDAKFIEISSKLSDTAALTKDNMQMFDDSTKSLNEWIKKQRYFVDGVSLLIEKLDEISKINDYSEEFWKNTKKGLNEAVGSIQSSVDSLNNEIGELDQHFYQRLNATLSELDTCMQAMIQGRR